MSKSGFTLLELLVGVVLTGSAVSLAAAIYLTTTTLLTSVAQSTQTHEERAVARAWLTQALAGVSGLDASFEGSPHVLQFHSSLWVREGWLERSTIEVGLVDDGVILAWASGNEIELFGGVHSLDFDYSNAIGPGAPWASNWSATRSPPAVIRMRLQRQSEAVDTLLFLVGVR